MYGPSMRAKTPWFFGQDRIKRKGPQTHVLMRNCIVQSLFKNFL